MIKKFKFDYDYENNSLFIYDEKNRSKASVEFDNLIIDFNSKKEIVSLELLNASQFLKSISSKDIKITKKLLKEIKSCKIDIKPQQNFILIKFLLEFESKEKISTPILIPNISEKSPASIA